MTSSKEIVLCLWLTIEEVEPGSGFVWKVLLLLPSRRGSIEGVFRCFFPEELVLFFFLVPFSSSLCSSICHSCSHFLLFLDFFSNCNKNSTERIHFTSKQFPDDQENQREWNWNNENFEDPSLIFCIVFFGDI